MFLKTHHLWNLVWLFFGGLGGVATTAVIASVHAPPTYVRENPPWRSLDATIYMQSSAEYRACCYQAFNFAEHRLQEATQKTPNRGKPAAVVLDLDETVFDNSGFQAMMTRSGLRFDQRLWNIWEGDASNVRMVPGSVSFLQRARQLGVATIFVSNRQEAHRDTVERILSREGVSVPDDHLLLSNGEGDKTDRRKRVSECFEVLLFIGDNLRDFSDDFKLTSSKDVSARKKNVDASRDCFGRVWIILPNPVYGEWTKSFGNSVADAELLIPE